MKRKNPILYIVVPCYNEEEVLPITCKIFEKELNLLITKGKISTKSKILFVNDGSKDGTWDVICRLSQEDNHFIGISQSRNRGHQNAVLAGLMESKEYADITISIDCDGQDDPASMEDMVDAYFDGAEVVYGVRENRDSDTFFKRFTAKSFYRILDRMGVEIIYDHADYRLISARVLQELANFQEVNLFLRGMIPLIGFKSTSVYYTRHERVAGKSHYSLSKMLGLAIDSITSLSIKPIHMIFELGLFITFFSFCAEIWMLLSFLSGRNVEPWGSMVCFLSFLAGIQLLCISVLGEYIGKMYMEVKHRPRYIISERTYDHEDLEEE